MSGKIVQEVNQVEATLRDIQVGRPNNRVHSLLRHDQKPHEPILHIAVRLERLLQLDLLALARDYRQNAVVLAVMEPHRLGIVKDRQQMGLDLVAIAGLAKDLQQRRIRHKKEARKDQPLLLQIPVTN